MGWAVDIARKQSYFEVVQQAERKYLRRFRIYFRLATTFRDLGWPWAAKFCIARCEDVGRRVRAEIRAQGFEDSNPMRLVL